MTERNISMGSIYKIANGKYAGRLCKALAMVTGMREGFCTVRLLDGFKRDTKMVDVIPVKYLE